MTFFCINITDDTTDLPSPVESEGDVQETAAEVERIADTDIIVATETAVADSEQTGPHLQEISHRCKLHLERLTQSLGQIRDVEALSRIEQLLAQLADSVEQDHPASKRRRMDPE